MYGWPIIWLGSGLFGWTLLEYGLHRYLGHTWNTPLRARHLKHHDEPEEKTISPIWSGIGAVLLFGTSMMGPSLIWLAVGCIAGYLNYERIHWHAHSAWTNAPDHLSHHDNPTGNFGVTTLLWDRVFGTSL